MSDTQEDVKTTVETTSDSTDTIEETSDSQEQENQKQNENTEAIDDAEEEPHIDYKAELAKAQEKAERAKQIANWERSKRKELQKSQEEEHVEKEGESLDIDSKLAELRREQAQDMIDDELDALSSNEDEKKLIKTIYESRVSPTGYTRRAIKDDLELAKLIANRPLYEKKLVERAKAEAKKELEQEKALTGSSYGVSGGRRAPSTPSPVLNAEESKWKTFIEKAKARSERRK